MERIVLFKSSSTFAGAQHEARSAAARHLVSFFVRAHGDGSWRVFGPASLLSEFNGEALAVAMHDENESLAEGPSYAPATEDWLADQDDASRAHEEGWYSDDS